MFYHKKSYQHDYRYDQYFKAKESGMLDNVLIPFEVLNIQGKHLGWIDNDAFLVGPLLLAGLPVNRKE